MFKKKTLPDRAAQPDTGDTASGVRPRRRIIAIVGLALLSVVALGGGLIAAVTPSALRVLLAGDGPAGEVAAPLADDAPAPLAGANLVVMPFDEMIVNITATTDSGRQTSRFMKLDLALVYDQTQDSAGLVETRHIFMRDAFQDYLRQLTDRDIEGTLGLVTLRSELLRRARAIAGSNAPHELVILGIVVQ